MSNSPMFFATEEEALAEIATFRGWPLAVAKEIYIDDGIAPWIIFADDSDDAKSYNKDGYFQ